MVYGYFNLNILLIKFKILREISPGLSDQINWRGKNTELSIFMLEQTWSRKQLPCGSYRKESDCNGGDLGLIPGLERSPGGGPGNRLQYFCLEKRHGQRSLAGSSPWGCKESGMMEPPGTHTSVPTVQCPLLWLCKSHHHPTPEPFHFSKLVLTF